MNVSTSKILKKRSDSNEEYLKFPTDSLDNYLGLRVTSGYVDISESKDIEQKVFYMHYKNTSNLGKDAPLIIVNVGGPGVSETALLFCCGGPYKLDSKLKNIQLRPQAQSLLKYGDLLLPEFPLNTGFSISDKVIDKISTNNKNELKFLTLLGQTQPKLNISKNKKLYFYGISYGGIVIPGFALTIKNDGWNVKGIHLESPFTGMKNMVHGVTHFFFDKKILNVSWQSLPMR